MTNDLADWTLPATIELCECVCGCQFKLLTLSSKQSKRCSGCRIGNCRGGNLI